MDRLRRGRRTARRGSRGRRARPVRRLRRGSGGQGRPVRRGDLDDLDGIRAGAADADAVIHLANKHDWSNPAASNAAERAAVQTIGDALAGTGRPFLLASGVAALAQGRPATEDDPSPFHGPDSPRGGSENLALEFVERGVHTVSLRFAPTVHGMRDHGFIAALAGVAREKGVSGYPGDGTNRWAAVHRLRRRAAGRARPGEGARRVPVCTPSPRRASRPGRSPRRSAAALGLPVTSVAPDDAVRATSGGSARFFAMDLAATSTATRELLGWTPDRADPRRGPRRGRVPERWPLSG